MGKHRSTIETYSAHKYASRDKDIKVELEMLNIAPEILVMVDGDGLSWMK